MLPSSARFIAFATMLLPACMGQNRGTEQPNPSRHASEEPASTASKADPSGGRTITVGEMAPAFALESTAGQTVELADLIEQGPTVVVFYRGHW